MDCCICYILTPIFASSKSIEVSALIEKVKVVYSVLRYEFIEKLKQKPVEISVQARLEAYEFFGEMTIKDNVISKASIKKQKSGVEKPISLVSFFNKLSLHLIDTYLIVIMSVMDICLNNYEIREDNLINELHQMIITMHSQNLITQLHSCLKETIATALASYLKHGLLVSKSHTNQNGGVMINYTSPVSNKPKIDELMN